jgi:hypothetical protein
MNEEAISMRRNPAVFEHYYEGPPVEPVGDEIWCYCDRPCYSPGDRLRLHVSTTARTFGVEITHDAPDGAVVYQRADLSGRRHRTPADASVAGCGWPDALELRIPTDWPAGGYRVTCRIDTGMGPKENHQLFLLRSSRAGREARVLLVAATGTWCAYNDWGGSNHYTGITGAGGDQYAPLLSLERPLPRGFVVLPADAPRAALAVPPAFGEAVSYPHMEWAYANGYSKKYASAGWASYERHFVHWAHGAGFEVDVISQYDLQLKPEALEDYRCLAFIGHDEYWSWEMRDTIDAYVEAGGRVARFAGNFMWQTRLEDGGRRQVCYKYRARDEDPLRDSERTTGSWEAPEVNRPGSLTFGLNALHGVYAGWGGCVAFGAGGFPLYRPDHWAFDGTGLGYGDVLGADSRVFAYEVDGLDYLIRDGLPYPAEQAQVPEDLEILAVGLASNLEVARGVDSGELFLGSDDAAYRAGILYGEVNAETLARAGRGSGMIVSFRRGQGEVFHAGSVEWVAGLLRRDPQVERVTRNVLARFLRG